jgi:hypothetical protein
VSYSSITFALFVILSDSEDEEATKENQLDEQLKMLTNELQSLTKNPDNARYPFWGSGSVNKYYLLPHVENVVPIGTALLSTKVKNCIGNKWCVIFSSWAQEIALGDLICEICPTISYLKISIKHRNEPSSPNGLVILDTLLQ